MTEVDGRPVRPRGEPDDELVQRLRGLVADRMAQQAGRDGAMTAAARSRLGRALIREVLEEEAEAALTSGRAPLDQAAEQQVADRIYADLWGLGGFQPYLDEPRGRVGQRQRVRPGVRPVLRRLPLRGSRRSRPATRS